MSSYEDELRRAAIGDVEETDDENEGLSRRGGGSGAAYDAASHDIELEARESARRFLWDEDEEVVTFTAGKPDVLEHHMMHAVNLKDDNDYVNGKTKHRLNSVASCCLGCYHVSIGICAMLCEKMCSPPCRRIWLALLAMGLLLGGVMKLSNGIQQREPPNKEIPTVTTSTEDRLGDVEQKILRLGVSNQHDLRAPNSAPHKAWQWISQTDEAQIDVGHDGFLSRYVLAVLYFSTTSTAGYTGSDNGSTVVPLTDAPNWMSSKSVCRWYGVECLPRGGGKNKHGSVMKLNLTESGLTGSIPSELLSLSDLEVLDLRMNALTGSIPPNIVDMESLIDLSLQSNQLSGSVPVPKGNPHIRQLDLGHNKLSGSIPWGLAKAVQLWVLALNNNELVGTLPDLSGLRNLETLLVEHNQLTGTIPTSLFKLSKLEDFRLGNNQFSGSIPTQMSQLIELEILNLQENSLVGKVPDMFVNLPKLIEVNLAWNKLTGTIHESYGTLNKLTKLVLDENDLTGSIPTSLGQITALKILFLTQNRLKGTVPTELGRLANLEDFRIQANELTGNLPSELGQCTKLHDLYAEYNYFVGGLPAEYGNLRELVTLKLEKNGFSGTMPDRVCDLMEQASLTTAKVDCQLVECTCCKSCA